MVNPFSNRPPHLRNPQHESEDLAFFNPNQPSPPQLRPQPRWLQPWTRRQRLHFRLLVTWQRLKSNLQVRQFASILAGWAFVGLLAVVLLRWSPDLLRVLSRLPKF